MKPNLKHLPPDVAARLLEFHGRKQFFRALRIVMAMVIAYAALLLLCTHVDRFVFLSTTARQTMLWGTHVAIALLAVAGAAWFKRNPATPRRIAYDVETAMEHRTHPSAQRERRDRCGESTFSLHIDG